MDRCGVEMLVRGVVVSQETDVLSSEVLGPSNELICAYLVVHIVYYLKGVSWRCLLADLYLYGISSCWQSLHTYFSPFTLLIFQFGRKHQVQI